jgi:hypothetical protein
MLIAWRLWSRPLAGTAPRPIPVIIPFTKDAWCFVGKPLNYADLEVKVLANAAKCIKFAAAYGASTETIAKVLGKTLTIKGDMKMAKQKTLKEAAAGGGITERYNVRGMQMIHKKGTNLGDPFKHKCAFCGAPSEHRFRAQGNTQRIYLCTKHMVQFFHLKPNRMAPKVKAKFVPMPDCMPRDFMLTRTLDAPLPFYGKRVFFFDAGKILGVRYFFSIYRVIKSREIEEPLVFTVTGVGPLEKTHSDTPAAIHYVQPYYPESLQIQMNNMINFMKDPVRCHPHNATSLSVYLTDAATRFYTDWCTGKREHEAEQAAYEMGG